MSKIIPITPGASCACGVIHNSCVRCGVTYSLHCVSGIADLVQQSWCYDCIMEKCE